MEYGAVHAILVTIQLLDEVALFTPVASCIKDVCGSVSASRSCNKHLVPANAALKQGDFF